MTKTKIIAAACTALALSFGSVAAVAPAQAKTMHKHMMKKKGMMKHGMSKGGMQGNDMQGGGMQGGGMTNGQNNGM